MNIKGHGSRHAALNLTRAMKWERVLRNEFGTWKTNAADEERLPVSRSTAKSQSCSTMSDSYSRNIPALNNGCQIRLKLIRTIQGFLGNREWKELIPVTSDYSFLPGASFTDSLRRCQASSSLIPLHQRSYRLSFRPPNHTSW